MASGVRVKQVASRVSRPSVHPDALDTNFFFPDVDTNEDADRKDNNE